MHFLTFLRQLTDSFFRWWWAVLTGLASLFSWFGVPNGGVLVSRLAVALAVFGALGLVFLVAAMIVRSYEWFLGQTVHPRVVRVVAGDGGETLFVVRAEGRPLSAGNLLAVHRDVAGEEICIAVLRFDRSREDGEGDQCEAIWISAGHQNELARGRVKPGELLVRREISASALDRLTGAAR
jgi:hypothetical protein